MSVALSHGLDPGLYLSDESCLRRSSKPVAGVCLSLSALDCGYDAVRGCLALLEIMECETNPFTRVLSSSVLCQRDRNETTARL